MGYLLPDDNYCLMQYSCLNILASINEAFGRVIIEAMGYGVPTCTFNDLEAVPEIYNENVMMLAEKRTDESFSNAIKKALEKSWDKETIIEHSRRFSMDKCVNNYLDVYRTIINEAGHGEQDRKDA